MKYHAARYINNKQRKGYSDIKIQILCFKGKQIFMKFTFNSKGTNIWTNKGLSRWWFVKGFFWSILQKSPKEVNVMPNIPQREKKRWNFSWGTDLLAVPAGAAAAAPAQGPSRRAQVPGRAEGRAAPAPHGPSFSKDNVAAASIFSASQTPAPGTAAPQQPFPPALGERSPLWRGLIIPRWASQNPQVLSVCPISVTQCPALGWWPGRVLWGSCKFWEMPAVAASRLGFLPPVTGEGDMHILPFSRSPGWCLTCLWALSGEGRHEGTF